jgi:hypothetical protein
MRRAALALVFLVAASCGTVDDRLFCGLSIPNGGAVSERELAAFLDEVVVPRFPDGFTVYRAGGHYNDAQRGPATESSVVIEIVHARGAREDRLVREIAGEYRRRFHQQAVLRVRAAASMQVITAPRAAAAP